MSLDAFFWFTDYHYLRVLFEPKYLQGYILFVNICAKHGGPMYVLCTIFSRFVTLVPLVSTNHNS